MAIEERLPPACAFAVSVLQEHEIDPNAVPEEAVEAAQEHLVTCARCLSSPPVIAPPRKKRKTRKAAAARSTETATLAETAKPEQPRVTVTLEEAPPFMRQKAEQKSAASSTRPAPATSEPTSPAGEQAPVASSNLPAVLENLGGLIDCAQCRELLPEYAEAMDSGQDVESLYPEIHDHLLICDAGCLVLLDLFREEARSSRKYRRRPVRDPLSAIAWELSGFFRTGQVPMSPMALAYGTLILLLLVASLSVFFTLRWDEARYALSANQQTIPTPDGIGLSDGLHIYDACNAASYQSKRSAAQALQHQNISQANALLTQATTTVHTDTSGCNGAEAAIYQEDLRVRQAGHPFGLLVVGFDSGPGKADPDGGTNRHMLYAAYTQELVGAYIAQSQYNSTRMNTAGAPLLYLVLANTTGEEQGALQIANTVADLAHATDLSSFGLLVKGQAPLLGLLGLAPSSLLQVALPVLCHAGVPVISPTATGPFLIEQLQATSMYQHCAPGFTFVRSSADDAGQSEAAANYAYARLGIRKAAVFSDPGNPSSGDSATDFLKAFLSRSRARIVAREIAVSSGLLDSNGNPQADSAMLLAGLNDALQAKPELIFAPMLTNDVITLAQAIAKLPDNQQPALMIGGEFVHPAALQGLVQWARQQKLTLPRIYVSLDSAVRPPVNDWQKQFYASFCQSFATPGVPCSGIAALDQGALLFADGVEMLGLALQSDAQNSSLPTSEQLVQKISQVNFAGVSGQIALRTSNKILMTSRGTSPVILGLQEDGSLQIAS